MLSIILNRNEWVSISTSTAQIDNMKQMKSDARLRIEDRMEHAPHSTSPLPSHDERRWRRIGRINPIDRQHQHHPLTTTDSNQS